MAPLEQMHCAIGKAESQAEPACLTSDEVTPTPATLNILFATKIYRQVLANRQVLALLPQPTNGPTGKFILSRPNILVFKRPNVTFRSLNSARNPSWPQSMYIFPAVGDVWHLMMYGIMYGILATKPALRPVPRRNNSKLR